jgi:dihydrofolate synthase/folylpolyglutamate synthase
MLASIMQSAGYRTGLYTSPHLKDFRERIRVNGTMIPGDKVARFVRKHREKFEVIQPSFFELTVGMAFDYFREQQVEVAVVEVGLGGRLDSTNIITPMLSVITNVSFDHMQLLGDTLEKIAGEKAGIIKQGVPVVVGETQEEVRQVFLQKAAEIGSEITFADQQYHVENFRYDNALDELRVMDIYHEGFPYMDRLLSPLGGTYQRKNIVTVVGACAQLNLQGLRLSPEFIRNGIRDVIKNTALAGRWQVLGRTPLTICDTGHNAAGLQEVLSQISATPHDHLHMVFGVVNDKDLPPILQMLPTTATYYFCKPNIPRGLEASELQRQAQLAGLTGECYQSVKEALHDAQLKAGKNDLVFVGGSTFVVAEVV